ncbi:MAG: MBL fold metallo-hydrolase [Gammaproteobacteria bacterium]|nr:MBL fold metallo-hydrolase [Gammaproteobacteria bacterium]
MKTPLPKRWLFPLVILGALLSSGYVWLEQPMFGRVPEGARLAAVGQSPHYRDGEFRNLEPIPPVVSEDGAVAGWLKFLLDDGEQRTPPGPIPVVKTDLHGLDRHQDLVIWLGHSSYFIQLGGRRLLLDPVLSRHASPVPFTVTAFEGASPYTVEDLPDIDYLLISHDHWDHLDYPTVMALQPRIGKVVAGLGVGAHFAAWGFAREDILEADWWSELALAEELSLHVLPARHYSGRLLQKNRTLWVGFALHTAERRLFFSGDSGYGAHFAAIGEALGPFDLAVLDSGQYDDAWRYVHMNPEDAARAAQDLNAAALLPAHVGKFSIAYHAWDDPFNRLLEASRDKDYRLLTPMIGEPLVLAEPEPRFARWWQGIEAGQDTPARAGL